MNAPDSFSLLFLLALGAGEAGGHRIAVGLHMPGVAVQQPQSHDQAGAACAQAQEAEGIRGAHLGSGGDAGSGEEL